MVYWFGLASFALAWLIPGHYFPWTGFQQETTAAIGVGILGMAALAAREVPDFSVPPVARWTGLLAVVPMAQWLAGQVPYLGDAALSSLYLLGFALTIAVAMALARAHREAFPAVLFGAFFVGALASSAVGLAQWVQVDIGVPTEFMSRGDRVYANFTQPNHLASVLGLGIVATVWLFECRHIGRSTALAAYLLFAFLLVATQSRTGWAFMLMLLVWWALRRRVSALRVTPAAVAGGLGAYLALIVSFPAINNVLMDLPTATALADRATSVGARAANWSVLWEAVWQRPWVGWGWMRVAEAQQAVTLNHPASHEWITFSHNLILDLLLWNGVVIGGAACLMAAWWITKRCLNCRDATLWCAMAAGGVLLTHALLEFPHAYLYFLLPMAVLIGVVEARTADGGVTPMRGLPKWAAAVAMAPLALLTAWVANEYLVVEDSARRVRFKEAGYVVAGEQPFVPDVILLDHQRDFLWFRMTEAHPGMRTEDVDRMRRVSERFMPPAVLLRYALATGLNGRPEEAQRSLQLVCHMWTARNCEEGRESWQALQQRYPQLTAIGFPSAP